MCAKCRDTIRIGGGDIAHRISDPSDGKIFYFTIRNIVLGTPKGVIALTHEHGHYKPKQK
jgi:hypothetical protein